MYRSRSYRVAWLYMCFALCCCAHYFRPPTAIGARVAVIAVLYSGSGPPAYSAIGVETRVTSALWLEQLQQTHLAVAGGIGDTDIVPQLVYCDVQANADITLECFRNLTAAHTLSAVMAPENELAQVIAPLTDALSIPMIATVSGLISLFVCDEQLLPPCKRPSDRRFQTLFSNGITVSQSIDGLLAFMRVYAASSVGIVTSSDAFNMEGGVSAVNEAQRNRFLIMLHTSLPADPAWTFGTYSVPIYQAATLIVRQLAALDPDVVVWASWPFCAEMADAFWDVGYYPRALMSGQCLEEEYATSEEGRERLRYTMGINTWFPQVVGLDFSDDPTLGYSNRFPPLISPQGGTISSAARFGAAYLHATGITAGSTQAGVYAGFYIIEAALAIANSTRPANVLEAVSGIDLRSFKGILQFNGNHIVNQAGPLLTQLSATGELGIVYPSSTFTAALIYPGPTFAERFDTGRPFQETVEWVVLVLSVGCCVPTLCCLVLIVRMRSVAGVRALHWQMSAVALMGVLLSNLSVLTWTVRNSPLQCSLRLWAWVGGVACMFLPLVSVFLRVYLIYSNASASLQQQPQQWQRRQAVSVLLLLGAGHGLLILAFLAVILGWHLQAPFHWKVLTSDPLRPSLNAHECISQGWSTWGASLTALMLLLLLILAGVSWSIRHVQDVRFHRFRAVMLVSFVWLMVLGVITILQATASASVSSGFQFGMRSVLLLLGNLFYLVLLFATPLYDAWVIHSQTAARPAAPAALPLYVRTPLPSLYPGSASQPAAHAPEAPRLDVKDSPPDPRPTVSVHIPSIAGCLSHVAPSAEPDSMRVSPYSAMVFPSVLVPANSLADRTED